MVQESWSVWRVNSKGKVGQFERKLIRKLDNWFILEVFQLKVSIYLFKSLNCKQLSYKSLTANHFVANHLQVTSFTF